MSKGTTDKTAAPDSNQRTLLTYAVLTGLTPLIPIPVADDLAKDYFRRRMVRALAEARGLNLSRDVQDSLSRDQKGGCWGGCLAQLLLYPLKKIFRKIIYFLEWKRAVDLTSQTYHYGYLVDYALQQDMIGPSGGRGASADEIRTAIVMVCREAPIKPIESAVSATFRQSKSVLFSAAKGMERRFRQISGKPDEAKVAQAVERVEEDERREVKGMIDRLQKMIENIPESHFRNLRTRLDAHLDPAKSRAKRLTRES